MNRDLMGLLMYLAAVVAATLVHDPLWLGLAAATVLLLNGRAAPGLLRRALAPVLLALAAVSGGMVLMAIWSGDAWLLPLLRLNLRVLLLVLLALTLVRRVNVVRALGVWPAVARALVIALGQARGIQRLLENGRRALTSRMPGRPRWRVRLRHAAGQAGTVVDRAVARGEVVAAAMRSRGALDD